MSTPPADPSAAGKSSMFSNAQNPHITGGSFSIINNVNVGDGPSLDVLFKRVAPNAILNAGGRADEVRCHPGTREEVIDRIEKWHDTEDSLTAPIFWLSGPAGAGKSAIMQTIAERCEERGVPHANFFFFRADASRSDASPLIATLLHQIVLLYPFLRDHVAPLLSANPLIFHSTLDNQLLQLIVTPLDSVQQSSSPCRPLLLLIDGLDECDSKTKRSQQQILRAFDKILAHRSRDCPFRLLVASRNESQIQAAFNGMSSECINLYLDDQYSPENDIRVFVEAQFKQVRLTHPLAYTLGATWPSTEDVNYIIGKSSGQFIYAVTVLRFISGSSASPLVSLERVKGAAQLATKSPFSHLDTIYTYILSQADDQEALKDILHAHSAINSAFHAQVTILFALFNSKIPISDLLQLVNRRYTIAMILSCLADITPIAQYNPASGNLLFYHASFYDYLEDHSRSGVYSLDMSAFHYKILPVVWRHLIDNNQREVWWVQFGLCGIARLEKLPPHLMSMVATTNFLVSPAYQPLRADIFNIVYQLCNSDDDMNHFRRFFYNWVDTRSMDHLLEHIRHIPFGCRYYYMTRSYRFNTPDSKMIAALHPETNFDRHESSVWLRDTIFSRHRQQRPNDIEGYKQLLESWIPWAVENNIPYDVFEDLPYVRQYIKSATKK